jgi:hypothetical protein
LFLGDTSEVAAAKQQLLAKGVADFNSGAAKSIIQIAGNVDKLREANKAQAEYTTKLAAARQELTQIRDDANFKLRFTNATELDTFNEKVRKGAFEFRGLANEIELTRRALNNLAVAQGATSRNTAQSGVLDSLLGDLLAATGEGDALTKRFREIGRTLGLKGIKELGTGLDLSAEAFAVKVKGFSDAIAAQTALGLDSTKIEAAFTKYLQSFTVAAGDKNLQVFTDDVIPQFILAFTKLNQAVGDQAAAANAQKYADSVKDLQESLRGLGLLPELTELDRLNEILNNPENAAAIKAEADAVGMLVDEYKDLLRLKRQMATATRGATRARIVATDADKQAIFTNETLKEGLKDLGTNAVGAVAQGVGDLVNQWVLYGTAGPDAMRKMTASVLAGVAAQAAVKAVFQLAEGFAALFFNPAEAAAHFQSAALFGSIALGAGVAGRAVAGDSFSQGAGGSNSGSPDYQTSSGTNAPPRNTRGNPNIRAVNPEMSGFQKTIEDLRYTVSRLSSASPGDVLTAGIKQKPGHITQTNIREMKGNASFVRDTARVMKVG